MSVLENIDIKNAIELLHGKELKEKYGKYSKLYAFTTENIAGYYSKFDFQEKFILTVCGSGDHVLNAILLGSKKIDAFDINIFTYYFLNLKIAAVKALTYREFLQYFLLENNDCAMKYSLYLKLKQYLEKDISDFWEQLYQEVHYDGKVLRNSSLFHNLYDTNNKKLMSNLYLKEKEFQDLKQKMKDVEIHFIDSSLLDLKNKCKSDYDLIFLSNISDYLKSMFSFNLLENYRKQIVEPLQKKLLLNGKIIFIYQYDVGTIRSIVDNTLEVKKVFSNMKEITFQSVVGKNKQDKIIYIEE